MPQTSVTGLSVYQLEVSGFVVVVLTVEVRSDVVVCLSVGYFSSS